MQTVAPRQYTFLRAIVAAWYSKDVYRDVAQHWRGVATAYLLILLTLVWLPALVGLTVVGLYFKHTDNYPQLLKQIPHIVINAGELKINKAPPHRIADDKGHAFVVFDTGAVANDIVRYGALLMFTKHDLVVLTTSGIKVIDLKNLGDWDVTAEKFDAWVTTALYWLVAFGFPSLVIMSLLYRLGEAFLLGIAAWLLARVLRCRLDFIVCVRLAAVALTPAIFLSLLDYFNPALMYHYLWIPLLLSLSYVTFAVLALRTEPRPR
jgi:Protein of unknown function (DUF1189)